MLNAKEQMKFGLIGIAALSALAAIIEWIDLGDSKTKVFNSNNQPQQEQQKIDKSVDIKSLELLENNLGFLIAGNSGQSINFGNDENLDCSATWQLNRLDPQAENALIKKTKRKEDNTFFIECYFQDQYFIQSSKHDTLAEIIITDNKPEDKTASFVVKFKLLNTSSDSPIMLSIGYQKIIVTPEQYELIF
jgi:hypothetical protein